MSEPTTWPEQNREVMALSLSLLADRLAPAEEVAADASADTEALENLRAAMEAPPALDRLVDTFGLSPFERDLLLLSAGVELDGDFAARCARAQEGDAPAPTFALALACLPGAHWSALSPGGPLRSWRLIELEEGGPLTRRRLSIDERILHYLVGVQHVDERLQPLLQPAGSPGSLPPSHQRLAEAAAEALRSAAEEATAEDGAGPAGGLPAIQLVGPDATARRQVAAAAAAGLGLDLHVLRASAVPSAPAEADGMIRLWRREALLAGRALLLDADHRAGGAGSPDGTLDRVLDDMGGVLFVSGRHRRPMGRRPLVTFEVEKPPAGEQIQLWGALLGEKGAGLNGDLESLVGHFQLEAAALRSAARQALAETGSTPDAAGHGSLARALWKACRRQGRPRLDPLAQRIDSRVGWDDLVLPAEQKQALKDLAVQVRQRPKVHGEWGFARRSSRGLGITALFAGVSGTGKTLAAEVLANELSLDLYRIDLASVISKYIGETEKNLGQVFDAAEGGGVVLLFDEADALFGKRSEVKDSHDRYANVEISYLLQRMEAYRGLAILTSNKKSALDSAFLRRLRLVVEFAFPGPRQRAEIWKRIFPAETPVGNLDPSKLARLNVTGGNIHSIALGAAYAAAEEDRPVGMDHLLKAARAEYRKLEKPLNEAEIRGWLA